VERWLQPRSSISLFEYLCVSSWTMKYVYKITGRIKPWSPECLVAKYCFVKCYFYSEKKIYRWIFLFPNDRFKTSSFIQKYINIDRKKYYLIVHGLLIVSKLLETFFNFRFYKMSLLVSKNSSLSLYSKII
jgi:hypothetical protein